MPQCGSTDHFIKDCPQWKNEKSKGKTREAGRMPKKGNFRTDFRKAMIAAWDDTESEAETEVPVEEETANLCLMASHEETKEREVMSSSSSPKHLFSLSKDKLIKLFLETQEKLEEKTAKCLQIEKDLKLSKDHISYLNTFRIDVQSRFFDLLDKNVILKEQLEKIKQEFIIFNIEKNQNKLLELKWDENDKSTHVFSTEFQEMKLKLESCERENKYLKDQLNLKGKGKSMKFPNGF